MTTIYAVQQHYVKSGAPAANIHFVEKPRAGKQASLRGRTVLEPVIDLSEFTFRAVIDWIEVIVHIDRKSQRRHIRRKLHSHHHRPCFVVPIEPGPGGEAEKFRVRFQEPPTLAAIQRACTSLGLAPDDPHATIINAVEISLDALPRRPDQELRAALFGTMAKTIFSSADLFTRGPSRPRFNFERRKKPTFLFPLQTSRSGIDPRRWPAMDRLLPVDATLSLGAIGDPAMVKLMDKVIDRQNRKIGKVEVLPLEEQRVRIEVTLQQSELRMNSVETLPDLITFLTQVQGGYFQFKLPTFAPEGKMAGNCLQIMTREKEARRRQRFFNAGVIGMIAMSLGYREFRDEHRRELVRIFRQLGKRVIAPRRGDGKLGTFVSYEPLNRKAADAFQDLRRRESRAWRKMHGVET